MIEMSLGELAAFVGGKLSDESAAERPIRAVRSLTTAGETDVTWYQGDRRYLDDARQCKGAAIIAEEPIEGVAGPYVIVEDAQEAVVLLSSVVRDLQNPPPVAGVDPGAHVDSSAQLGEGVYVGPGSVIQANARIGARSRIGPQAFVGQGAVLGEECVLHPGAVVLHNVQAGDRLVMWPHAVVGRDGFGFFQTPEGHKRIPQIGGVFIGDDVELGCWSSIDRGRVDPTTVGDGVKVDSHCHIAHNCKIGKHVILVGFARMGGSAEIGDYAILAQEGAVGERRKVGAGAIVGSAARVLYSDVGPGEKVLGTPARHHIRHKRIEASLNKLPELLKEVRDLRKRLEKLEGGA